MRCYKVTGLRSSGFSFQAEDGIRDYKVTGVQTCALPICSLTVVLLTGLFTGAALALQSGQTLDQFGARPVVGRLVSASMIKELGPVLTALMLAGDRKSVV